MHTHAGAERGCSSTQDCSPCKPTVWAESSLLLQLQRQAEARGKAAAAQEPTSGHLRTPAAEAAWRQALRAALARQQQQQQQGSRGGKPEAGASSGWQESDPGDRRCGQELGRWVTPFRRRVGRWLTDVTPLRGLLGGERCVGGGGVRAD